MLHDTHIKLCTYTGESLKVLGVADVTVMYKGQETKLPLVVVGQGGPNLLGRDWLRALKLDKHLTATRQRTNILTIIEVHKCIVVC